ncbi:MAG TPA: hypothetical protein VFA39_02025 [Steroidobacteraceae bacterium]|nr:hypothetical protein [Steroidobacteraceae bacterium]
MKISSLLCLVALTVASLGTNVHAEAPTQLQVGQSLARARLLLPGSHLYLRYNLKNGKREVIDIWRRDVRLEPHDGRRLLHIVQRWDGVGEHAYALEQDAWFEPATFRPITQVKRVTRDGKTTVGGYRFLPDKVIGMDDLPDNVRKGFSIPEPEPAYNFETDMELLSMLPLAEGYVVSIPFYDPGLDPPQRYIFKVAGSERIRAADGPPVDCWVVTADYGLPDPPTKFWFDKQTQVLLREERLQKDGSILVKTLVTPDTAIDRPNAPGPG